MNFRSSSPLVSIATPVYNGAQYIAECIESVLAQTYSNWDYTIVNNVSTDQTLDIVEKYAAKDSRIRIVNNTKHVRVVENHNHAIRAISPQSKYCKLVEADDWLYPDCVRLMVALAEENPSVGIVGAFGLFGTRVAWHGLPYTTRVMDGRELCRLSLLGQLAIFGSPTTSLLRSDLVRRRDPFYNEWNIHSDLEACYEMLADSDFGFIHQVLTFTRTDNESMRTMAKRLNSDFVSHVYHFSKFGPLYLDQSEFAERLEMLIDDYYRFLGWSAFPRRGEEFWQFHRKILLQAGHPLSRLRLLKAILGRVLSAVVNPKRSIEGAWQWFSHETS
jgi:glycosyltransferase involved in cell wall biosynthesis